MSRQRRRDTACELAVRRELFRRGLRFRIDRPLAVNGRRKADITFSRLRIVVFVNGCFWHACRSHASWPKRNADWWQNKLVENQRRDVATYKALRRAGWTVVKVWEHEQPVRAADRIERVVRQAQREMRT